MAFLKEVHVKALINQCFKSRETYYREDFSKEFIENCLKKEVNQRPKFQELNEMLKESPYFTEKDNIKNLVEQDLLEVKYIFYVKEKINGF